MENYWRVFHFYKFFLVFAKHTADDDDDGEREATEKVATVLRNKCLASGGSDCLEILKTDKSDQCGN